MAKKKIYFFIGTTTELVRIAPVLKELSKRRFKYKIISSGQNQIKTQQLLDYLGPIKIDIAFPQKINKSSALQFLFWSIKLFFVALFKLRHEFKGLNKKNSHFVIFGDPVSTSIGAIIAKIYGLNLVHLESGDLSFDLTEPFPEEICRHINIHLADVLFPPSDWAMNNLAKIPGLSKKQINTHYNTQTEVFNWALKSRPTPAIKKLISNLGNYYILIMHRQEHVFFSQQWTEKVIKFIIQKSNPSLKCVMFDHPLSQEIVNRLKPSLTTKQRDNIQTLSMLTYAEFLHLMKHAQYIASDSATNQYEAYLMGQPYLALRKKVEQVEGLDHNVVISKGELPVMQKFLKNYSKYRQTPIKPKKNPSQIITDYLVQ